MIVITNIVQPKEGWITMYHCNVCKTTTIILNPYAIKPNDGDYWLFEDSCIDFIRHNLPDFPLRKR